jgi:hypothetical protein
MQFLGNFCTFRHLFFPFVVSRLLLEICLCYKLGVKEKGKASPITRHGGAWGERSYPQGKDPWYPLDRTLGGPRSRNVHRGYTKNPFASAGYQTSDRLVVQYVAIHYTD